MRQPRQALHCASLYNTRTPLPEYCLALRVNVDREPLWIYSRPCGPVTSFDLTRVFTLQITSFENRTKTVTACTESTSEVACPRLQGHCRHLPSRKWRARRMRLTMSLFLAKPVRTSGLHPLCMRVSTACVQRWHALVPQPLSMSRISLCPRVEMRGTGCRLCRTSSTLAKYLQLRAQSVTRLTGCFCQRGRSQKSIFCRRIRR